MTLYARWHEQASTARQRGMKRVKRAMIAAFSIHIFTPMIVLLCLTAIFLLRAG
ncbi:MAG TPA: hypothetical protein VMS89_08440 [Methanoregulaceae archaeon]|nr:hypothetical protein [Methanoregulaceae archaeon]